LFEGASRLCKDEGWEDGAEGKNSWTTSSMPPRQTAVEVARRGKGWSPLRISSVEEEREVEEVSTGDAGTFSNSRGFKKGDEKSARLASQ
jgi:hypothetical protein